MRFLTSALLLNAALASSAIAQSANPDFTRCIEGLRGEARAARVQDEAFTRFTQGLTPDMSVVEKLDYQPEFRMPIWDYLAALVDDERVADGQAQLAQHAEVLAKVAESPKLAGLLREDGEGRFSAAAGDRGVLK